MVGEIIENDKYVEVDDTTLKDLKTFQISTSQINDAARKY